MTAERNPQARLLHMLPAVARYLKFNFKHMKIRPGVAEDSPLLDDVTLGSPKRNKAELKEAAQQEKAKVVALSAECDALVAENQALVAKTKNRCAQTNFLHGSCYSFHVNFFSFLNYRPGPSESSRRKK